MVEKDGDNSVGEQTGSVDWGGGGGLFVDLNVLYTLSAKDYNALRRQSWKPI